VLNSQVSGTKPIQVENDFADDPFHAVVAERKRLLSIYFASIAKKANAKVLDWLARQLLIIKEGAIVLAHLGDHSQVAADARAAAKTIIQNALRL